MKSAETPLHKVQGMGASHSGTGHFWRERVTAVALIPLSLWFAFTMLGLASTNEVVVVQYLAEPWNWISDGGFRRGLDLSHEPGDCRSWLTTMSIATGRRSCVFS